MSDKTKNDVAWEALFDQLKILEHIAEFGSFEISSSQINRVRESRLMAKFDHFVNLPFIFRQNDLSILPISRSKYLIGHFSIHSQMKLDKIEGEPILVDFPDEIESIDYSNIYSENVAVNCAFLTGMINDLIGEAAFHTVSGRMSTGCFDFHIGNKNINSSPYKIRVENSQCEIDSGFESENYLILIEAKNYFISDFLVRQLYYPYRLWEGKTTKKILPVIMTFSNDIFSFFVFEFRELNNYNSICLINRKDYFISSEPISLEDVSSIVSSITLKKDIQDIPFPQADRFERIVDLLTLLSIKNLTRDEITLNYQFNIRQTNYYTDAARFLGLVEKYIDSESTEITFQLTKAGKKIFRKKHKLKYLSFIQEILRSAVFFEAFSLAIKLGKIPNIDEISIVMSHLPLSESTIKRRARTVRQWISWIWSQIID